MADSKDSATATLADAAASLRATTKWIVGGVVATAASVLAGSSLTNLGTLDPLDDLARLLMAVGGAALGFFGLSLIFRRAIAVLTLESVTFRMLARAEASDRAADAFWRGVAHEVVDKYRSELPKPITSLSDYVRAADSAGNDAALLAAAGRFNDLVMPDAGFLSVRARFNGLIAIMPLAIGLTVVGLGTFAWAANPAPKKPAPQKAPLLVITPR
ncbi:MAG: hypothetical protein V4574_13115 [Pseudomonadota bacterium]